MKGLVELHGGSVEATSDGPGMGSTFTVRLARSVVSVSERQDIEREHGIDGNETTHGSSTGGCKILIADDNGDTAESLGLVLGLAGHAICLAFDGEQALVVAEREKPEVMVLDIGMPGMNGYELAARVRQEAWGQRCLLVAATGWGQDDDKFRAKAAGFDAHLTKPFDPQALLNLIREQRQL